MWHVTCAPNGDDLNFREWSQLRIINFVKRIEQKSSFGEDLVYSMIIKSFIPTIIQPIKRKHLIPLSLRTGNFPDK